MCKCASMSVCERRAPNRENGMNEKRKKFKSNIRDTYDNVAPASRLERHFGCLNNSP